MWGKRATLLVATVVLVLGVAACSSQPQVLEERQLQQEQQTPDGRQVLVVQQQQIEQLEQQVEQLQQQVADLEQQQDSAGGGIFGNQRGFGNGGGDSGDSSFGERDQRQVIEEQQRRLDQLERQVQGR